MNLLTKKAIKLWDLYSKQLAYSSNSLIPENVNVIFGNLKLLFDWSWKERSGKGKVQKNAKCEWSICYLLCEM